MRSTDSEIVGYLRVVQILDSLPALVGYVDLDLRIVYANKLIEEWYQRPLSELVGMQLKTLFSAEHYQTVETLLRKVLDGTEVNEEREIQYPDGETRQVNLNYIPDRSNGQVLGYFFLVQDVTERNRAQEAYCRAWNSKLCLSSLDREENGFNPSDSAIWNTLNSGNTKRPYSGADPGVAKRQNPSSSARALEMSVVLITKLNGPKRWGMPIRSPASL